MTPIAELVDKTAEFVLYATHEIRDGMTNADESIVFQGTDARSTFAAARAQAAGLLPQS
ncbi:hypothetical protein [Nocardia arthritidis]|uniref:Uncharacterized protein n=1 Tax=Nocardia arthritidis TaxID=228602 RepID=A0A6G9YFI1_9NOCA|nr:hypothetical protein [Nocardia arthritidis]QIS11743.1 hypothetical protein F5544_19375 [Nocardia arthritidis]